MTILMLVLFIAGAIDTTNEGNDFKMWFSDKVLPRIKKLVGVGRNTKRVLEKLRNNPEFMGEFKKLKRGSLRQTVAKYLSDNEFLYLWDVTYKNIKTGELSLPQIKRRSFFGK
tara:strand:- start:970 stop:1308 length:339 start_codon:yes stop_codon:yes gene_type:complete